MRIWTIHPKYLDSPGLTAAWREGLLARAVLDRRTAGYRRHPQLVRFREHRHPASCIGCYLHGLLTEAESRGFRFDRTKLGRVDRRWMLETEGQLLHEWGHLMRKLRLRAPERHRQLREIGRPDPHPLFRIVPGDRRPWERVGRNVS